MSSNPIKITHELNWFQRLVQRFAWSRVGIWFGSNFLHYLDRLAIRLSKGKIFLSTVISGLPMILLTTTGAKSGLPRSVPLVALQDGDNWILIASSWGRRKHPGWYYNLRKNPVATIISPAGKNEYKARISEGEEAEGYWVKFIRIYPGYAAYRKNASHRKIGLFVMQPVVSAEKNS